MRPDVLRLPRPNQSAGNFPAARAVPTLPMVSSAGAAKMTVYAHGWKKSMKGTVKIWIKAAPSNGRRPDYGPVSQPLPCPNGDSAEGGDKQPLRTV